MIKVIRKSENKLIKNEIQYKKLLPQYLALINYLNKKYRPIHDPNFSELVNFKTNKEIARHNWFTYKQGYSEKLVKELLTREKPSRLSYVLDPFSGVGTTNVVAQMLGYKSIGFDINPVATFAAKVKTTNFSNRQVVKIEKTIKSYKFNNKSKHIPNSTLLDNSFSSIAFDKLMHIKGFFESLKDKKVRSFFKLAYLSIIEDCSNRIKDGNGIKIVKNKKAIENIYGYYIKKCNAMFKDVCEQNPDKESIIINGSIILNNDFKKTKNKNIGIVIFSPPYANCFDYCEVYKLELWMGDFVRNYEDFKKYREMALRSHVNSSFNHDVKNKNFNAELVSNVISCFNIWNKNIPDMIRGYFDDMTEIFRRLEQLMDKGAKCFMIVANSGYKGILVPTDLLLADIASRSGFKIVKIILARKIRASSQQMKELHGEYENLMRESIVVLEKK